MSSRNRLRCLLSGLLVLITCFGTVEAEGFGDLELHGFATQGFVKTSANSFFGDSEDGSFEFTELGVNATIQPSSDVRLSGQLLSRRAGDVYSDTLNVDFALVDLTIHSSEQDRFGLLVGRVKNPLGLFNETRDVAFTRPSIFLPQVIYFDKLRNVIMSADGVGLQIERYTEGANASLYLAAGQPQIDENVEYVYLGTGFSGDFEPDGLSTIARLLVETPDNRLRAALSFASTSMDFERNATDPINDGNVQFEYWIASLQYVAEDWTLTAEYMREPIDWSGFEGSPFDGMSTVAEGYYVQAAWQTREDVEFVFRYEEGFADRADRSGQEIDDASLGTIPSYTRYSKIFTAGVRWDVSSSIMLRAEYQRHNGTFVLSNRENSNAAELDPDWDMFSLTASYRF